MRGLKIIVSVMTILIVVGVSLVIYGFMRSPNATNFNIELQSLILPKNTTIKQISANDKFLAIYAKSDKKDVIYFIEPSSGKIKYNLPIEYEK